MFENFHAALALQLADGVGRRDVFALERAPEDVLDMLRSGSGRRQLSVEVGGPVGEVDWDAFDVQLSAMERTRAQAVCWWDAEFPECLRNVPEPPALLFYRGSIEALEARGVAVVGTRKPTPAGVAQARRLGRALAAAGVTVVSGLARGIDTAAHMGSLAGPGAAVGVVGTGIDVPYPEENAGLMVEVARAGCVVSEQLMGMHAERWVFPRRNRLISGLSHAVVVVQGGIKSGALITARWALEQGRDVGAVPGFPGDFRSDGPNALLKQGAFVVEDVRDIIEAVPALRFAARGAAREDAREDVPRDGVADAAAEPPGSTRRRVLDAVGTVPSGPDDLAAALGCAVEEVQRALSELEIDARVTRDETGRYTRARA